MKLKGGYYCRDCGEIQPLPEGACDQVDQAEPLPEVAHDAPPDESLSEIWVATSRQDLLDQAVAILRKVPLDDRAHLLEIVYRQEQLEQMQAEFRQKLLGA